MVSIPTLTLIQASTAAALADEVRARDLAEAKANEAARKAAAEKSRVEAARADEHATRIALQKEESDKVLRSKSGPGAQGRMMLKRRG